MKRQFKLYSQDVKLHVCRAVMQADFGKIVTIEDPVRKSEQNAKIHAMLGDIAKQCEFMGQKWDIEDWKRILVDAFARVMKSQGTPLNQGGRIIPALDGEGFVQLGIQTRKFRVKEASEFIEYLHAFAAERGVRFTAAEWEYA